MDHIEAVEPIIVVESRDKKSRVSVLASNTGATLVFDTPTGEVRFYVKDDGDWQKITDAVWMAMRNTGIFDRSDDAC